MKNKNKQNHIRMRFSTLILCYLAFVLCATPCDGAFLSLSFTEEGVYCNGTPCDEVYCNEDGEYDVTEQLIDTVRYEKGLGEGGLDMLDVRFGTTVNLYTSVTYSVQAHPGSILNIHSGSVGLYVILSTGEPKPIVTVYGTNFEVDWKCNGTFVSLDGADEFTPDSQAGSILKGFYGNSDSEPFELRFLSNGVPIKLKETDSKVMEIDIKPGGNPNNINLKSRGVVPVAVLTTEDFDADDVDPTTVKFAGASPVRWKLCDVNGDGKDDMLFHFKTQELQGLDENSKEATLTCKTLDGKTITGTDTVRIVLPKKEK